MWTAAEASHRLKWKGRSACLETFRVCNTMLERLTWLMVCCMAGQPLLGAAAGPVSAAALWLHMQAKQLHAILRHGTHPTPQQHATLLSMLACNAAAYLCSSVCCSHARSIRHAGKLLGFLLAAPHTCCSAGASFACSASQARLSRFSLLLPSPSPCMLFSLSDACACAGVHEHQCFVAQP